MLYKVNPRLISMIKDKRFELLEEDDDGPPQIVKVVPGKRKRKTGEVIEWLPSNDPSDPEPASQYILFGHNCISLPQLESMSLLLLPGDAYPDFGDRIAHQVFLWKNKKIAFWPGYFVDARDFPPGHFKRNWYDYAQAPRYPMTVPVEEIKE